MPLELTGGGWALDDAPIGLLVLGLGNLLCADDGIGSAATLRLAEEWVAPPGVRIADGGTLGLALMPLVERAECLLLLDAVAEEGAPGSFVTMRGEEVGPAVAHRLSPHQIGVADLLDGLRLVDRLPREIILLGLVPESLEMRVGLSPSVEAGLPRLIEGAVCEAERLGFPFRRKAPHVAATNEQGPLLGLSGRL